jgi:hypothetical protein
VEIVRRRRQGPWPTGLGGKGNEAVTGSVTGKAAYPIAAFT